MHSYVLRATHVNQQTESMERGTSSVNMDALCTGGTPIVLESRYAGTMMKFNAFHRLLALAALVVAPLSAVADSWAPPTTEVTLSANGQYRVTVVPRPIGGPLAYFEDKVKGNEPAGQRKHDVQTSPLARVERLASAGEWRLIWQKPLVNDVGPPSVLLASDASFLVTFDNWHSAGYGDDVVVIYDRHGNLVRKLSLEQILPSAYVNHLPRSVSSRWWGGEHRLVDGDKLVELQVIEPGADRGGKPKYAPVRIRLVDGVVMPPSGTAWTRALSKATALESERQAAWEVVRQLRARPLSAPTSTDTVAWRDYMFELRERIVRGDEMMGGMVLAAPGANPGFHTADAISNWIEDYDGDKAYSGKHFIVASPTSDRLSAILVKSLHVRAEGSMKGVRIVFVGTPAEGRPVTEAAKRSGAEVTIIDRTKPFPAGKPLPKSPPPFWMP